MRKECFHFSCNSEILQYQQNVKFLQNSQIPHSILSSFFMKFRNQELSTQQVKATKSGSPLKEIEKEKSFNTSMSFQQCDLRSGHKKG